jgi:hypothetical protein
MKRGEQMKMRNLYGKRGEKPSDPIEKAIRIAPDGLLINAGNHLRSHTLTRAVPSAQRGLTSVFGMGTGVTLAVWSPANLRALGGVFPRSRDEFRLVFLGFSRGKLAP